MLLKEQERGDDLIRFKERFPAAVRSTRYGDMVLFIAKGKFEKAVTMAERMEKHQSVLQKNVTARRMRIARVSLLKLLRDAELDLRATFQELATFMAGYVLKWGGEQKNLKRLRDKSHDMEVKMRREIRKWLRRIIWDGSVLALKNTEKALLPIFKYNWESLREDRLVFDMDPDVANLNTPEISVGSKKWVSKLDAVIAANEKEVTGGFDLSDRIYHMTDTARKEVDRLVADGIVNGDHPTAIAKKLKKYLSPSIEYDPEGNEILPRGAYYSPYKNALRVARTEVLSVYHNTTAEYALDKWWVKEMMIVRADGGDDCEICDPYDGETVSKEEFVGLLPFHPHCMCYGAYVFDDEILADVEREPVDSGDDETSTANIPSGPYETKGTDVFYHATPKQNVSSIKDKGILPADGSYVFLTNKVEYAEKFIERGFIRGDTSAGKILKVQLPSGSLVDNQGAGIILYKGSVLPKSIKGEL